MNVSGQYSSLPSSQKENGCCQISESVVLTALVVGSIALIIIGVMGMQSHFSPAVSWGMIGHGSAFLLGGVVYVLGNALVSLTQKENPAAGGIPEQFLDPSLSASEGILKEFWEVFYKEGPDNLHRYFQLLVSAPEITKDIAIELTVDEYLKDPSLNDLYDDATKQKLKDAIKLQFNQDLLVLGSKIKREKTRGDGSCGIHAILGTVKNREWRVENIEEVRRQFCIWIRGNLEHPAAEITIANVLDDYFLRWDQKVVVNGSVTFIVPAALRTAENTQKRDELFKEYTQVANRQDLNSIERDNEITKVYRKFRAAILDSYLEHVANPGTYLLQEELVNFAIFANKKLVLHQKGHGKDSHLLQKKVFNEKARQSVHVYYNGYNHYEKAQQLYDY